MIEENIEKSLKRFLKRKVSVNESIVVKFLITGLIGATLTACGGGGGGGGSSSGGGTTSPVDPGKPQIEKSIDDVFGKGEIIDENIVINGEKTDNKLSSTSAITAKNSIVTNKANLSLSGEKVTAISTVNSNVINEANITLAGNDAVGIKGEINTVLRNKNLVVSIQNNGNINLNGKNQTGILVISKNGKISGINNGNINIKGDNSSGMKVVGKEVSIINNGVIKISGDYVYGINAYVNNEEVNNGNILSGTEIVNNRLIEITSKNSGSNSDPLGQPHSTGIYLGTNDGTAIVKNRGNIIMNGDKSVAVYAYNGVIANEKGGKISVDGDMGTGLYISGDGKTKGEALNSGEIVMTGNYSDGMLAEESTTATNNGTITIIGYNSSGMTAEGRATVINGSSGVINVDGEKSFGMKANGFGSSAINKGTINVGADASGGMLATGGGTISNEGTINIDKSHGLNDSNKKDFALQTQGEGSTIKNTGTINADREIKITVGTNYIIGTNSDGSYGKISAENISINGNVKVSTEIAKGNYKESYILDNVVSGNTELKENYKLSSTSVLYNASSKLDEKGNLDAELSRNENNLVDFISKEYANLASVFDKGINDKEFRDKLSDEAKDVLNNVFVNTTSKENIQNRLKEISGVEYTNIARQMFDTKDIFKSYDSSIINTLDDYQFNFNFIGNYSDVEAKNNLLGYDSKMTGISGAMKFNDSLYGVIGYGYNDIDFDGNSEGNIKSVHTGIYKDMKLNSFDVRLGVFGEYNFHEVKRNITNEIAKGDFNSYLLGACGEISQKFGDNLYVKPALSLDVTYGRYEDFTEEGAKGYNLTVDSQDYTSIVPTVEVKVGKDFEMASIYSAVKFGYEFGDMNKVQEFAFNGLGKYHLDIDEIENAQTDVKVGTAFEFNNFTLNAEVGKDFGKRDREYITAGFTYTF